MEFRDLRKQYNYLKQEINNRIQEVLNNNQYIMGSHVKELEKDLAAYVEVKHCITCANGTDALQLALMVWNVEAGDAVFVPDFTFFSSGEVVSAVGATPIFVDVDIDTYNMNIDSLAKSVKAIVEEGKLNPRVILAVDLFGQPAEYEAIREIAKKYNMYILEDGAQGFGGRIGDKKACSFGDISTTSFFPAKPLGCYGDGGAIFTDNDLWAEVLRSLRVHGKGKSKYDNIRIGMNSRLDTIQAAVLQAKLPVFVQEELEKCDRLSRFYTEYLKDIVKTPVVKEGYFSSWAQYTIQLENKEVRDGLQKYLMENGIPTMVYYQKPMHRQGAFKEYVYEEEDFDNTNRLCETVLSLPFYPYMGEEGVEIVSNKITDFYKNK